MIYDTGRVFIHLRFFFLLVVFTNQFEAVNKKIMNVINKNKTKLIILIQFIKKLRLRNGERTERHMTLL